MLLYGLIALCILSIVGFFVYVIKEHKDGTERMNIESQFLASYGAIFILFVLVLIFAGTNSSSEMSPAEEEIVLVVAFAFVGMALWAAIFLIEVVIWAIKKLICTMILRKHGICEIPSLNSNWNVVLTDDSIRETLALCKESTQYGVSDDFGEPLERYVVNGVLTYNVKIVLADPKNLEGNNTD